MENTFWTALGTSSLAALVTTIGIYVAPISVKLMNHFLALYCRFLLGRWFMSGPPIFYLRLRQSTRNTAYFPWEPAFWWLW